MSYTDIATANGITIRHLHSPDRMKTFGYLTGRIQPDNSLSDAIPHAHRLQAERALGCYSVVDRINDFEIRKLRGISGVLGYAAAHPDGTTVYHSTLLAARQAAGWKPVPSKSLTLPKTAYIQNTPGYRADAQRK
jgi:hypothetical protein